MLSDITIIIPTFHRRGYLADCLRGIQDNLPECKVVVVSDDNVIPQTENEIYLPYDSGLTAKRNAAVKLVGTKYTLIGSDDFDFSTAEVQDGIFEMSRVLELNLGIDVVVGRHNNKDYHGYLEYVPGKYIKEHRISLDFTIPFTIPFWGVPKVWKIDIGPNFFLARTEVLKEIPWDEAIRPIGGEHADFFLDLKEAGKIVVYLSTANINEQPRDLSKQDPGYRAFRFRAWQGHELMMRKRGIKKYFGFDEEVK